MSNKVTNIRDSVFYHCRPEREDFIRNDSIYQIELNLEASQCSSPSLAISGEKGGAHICCISL